MTRRVSVVGLGKLGASIAAAVAHRGHEVIGVDVSQAAIDAVNHGRAPVQETSLGDLIAANRARLTATPSHEHAVLNSEITFVVVPTPSDERGAFSLRDAAFAFEAIGRALARKRDYHTVVLTSTVLPGATRHGLIPILERAAGKRCGEAFGVCYSPEFVALGSVIRDFLHPDFLLLGEHDRRAGDHLEACYADIVANRAPVARMSLENAELTKVSLNAYVTMKITFANMLADICTRVPGCDVDVVSHALGLDSRIGRKYLRGGLGYGGPCFPRDNVALGFFAGAVGASADLPMAIDRLNSGAVNRIVDQIAPAIPPGARVAVLGLSYKPASHVLEASQAVQIVKTLADRRHRVVAFDPLAGRQARQELDGRAHVVDSIGACLADADVVLIANADPVFATLEPEDFTDGSRLVTVIDFWRCLAGRLDGAPGIRYIPYGVGVRTAPSGIIEANALAALWADGTPLAEPMTDTAIRDATIADAPITDQSVRVAPVHAG